MKLILCVVAGFVAKAPSLKPFKIARFWLPQNQMIFNELNTLDFPDFPCVFGALESARVL